MTAGDPGGILRPMSEQTPSIAGVSVEHYFAMTECGIIAPDDRVELLEGLVVSMAAQSAPHAGTVYLVQERLFRKLPAGTVVRGQSTFLAGRSSAPEPDVVVLPGRAEDYLEEHPTTAHLVVEVAHSSIIQDRITKAAIYARAGIPCYWIVNLRDRCVEVMREPDRFRAAYSSVMRATGDDSFSIDAFPGVSFTAAELLPPRPLPQEVD